MREHVDDESPAHDGDLIARSLVAPELFGEIYDAHAAGVLRYLRTRLPESVTEDLLASTFVEAFEHREKFDRQRSDARPWLFGIATNLMRQHWRQDDRRTSLIERLTARRELDQVGCIEIEAVIARVDSPRARRVLAAALGDLRGPERDVLLLSAWEGMKNAEIAEALSIPEGTVKSRLSRGRAALAKALNIHNGGETSV